MFVSECYTTSMQLERRGLTNKKELYLLQFLTYLKQSKNKLYY